MSTHAPTDLVKPLSLTHQHLFAVINTLLKTREDDTDPDTLRILDVGCGDGLLISYLQAMMDRFYSDTKIELYGFDIGDYGYKDGQQLPKTHDLLTRNHPHVDWSDRVKLIPVDADWGYPEHFFDVAVSNQVLEHVQDLEHVLASLKRHLKPNGFSAHMFPVKECIMEGHTGIPFLHRIEDFNSRVGYLNALNKLSIGRYKLDKDIFSFNDTRTHAIETSKFIQLHTFYRTFSDFHDAGEQHGLAVSHAYTKNFDVAKLRTVFGRPPVFDYTLFDFLALESAFYSLLKYGPGITLVIRPMQYDIGRRIALEKAYHQRERQWTERMDG